MPNNSSEAVFNLEALVFAGAVLFLILVVHALYMYITENWYEKIIDSLVQARRFSLARPAFYVMSFVLTLSHLLEIYIWGIALNLTGLISNSHHAMVFAGSAYTTVGFGTNPLPQSWDLVMVVIALSGMVAFGWSISVLVSMTQYYKSARTQYMKRSTGINS
ncbi:hypothetical protein G3I67_03585 [Orrella sp. NBD-18]|uniref:Potassium channel domain-containing protein n=1 Tax=Sheuella amnicola TaxID=2707330 RepID=A0A6B2QXC5_9BURK|nr:ion channel [Sheuella amnicola]NDY82308.1 hypothetical protein [Sheuella amnicola]HBI82502.1 hypothetical protein [Alcaligenaceae bacterium]